MRLPNILRQLPPVIAERVFYRYYNQRQHLYPEWFRRARLRLSPALEMQDLVPGDVISGQIALGGFYEYDLSRRIQKHSKHGGLFVDVGANIGYFTLIWLAGNPSNRAIAVEASAANQNRIETNISANGFTNRCSLIKKAAGHREQKVAFDPGPEEQTGWGGICVDSRSDTSDHIDMIRLDSIIQEKVAVLKIDVEGADTWVIKGCENLFRSQLVDIIFFEQNTQRMSSLGIRYGEAQEFLTSFGFKCELISDEEWMARRK